MKMSRIWSVRIALLALAALLLSAQGAYAYVLTTDGYYRKSIGINTSANVASTYGTVVSRAISSWNNSGVGVSITGGSAPYANILYTQYLADTWYGAYMPQRLSNAYYPHTCTQFKVVVNTRTCANLGTNGKQSVVCHELGHAFGLGHEIIKTAVMNPGRLRETVYTPQLDDKNGVVASWRR